MEFEDKIMLPGFREVKCWWEVGKGGKIMRWQGGKGGSGEVGRWEVPGFTQRWGTQGESKILSFCF